jgi:hypothetical protein
MAIVSACLKTKNVTQSYKFEVLKYNVGLP